MQCELKLLSSLDKVFFDTFFDFEEYTKGTMLKNEIFSFQLAIWGTDSLEARERCTIGMLTDLNWFCAEWVECRSAYSQNLVKIRKRIFGSCVTVMP